MVVRVLQLESARGLPLPQRMTSGSAGCDVRAAVEEPVVLRTGERFMVPTGLVFDIPQGFELQVRPRSGLAAEHGVTVLNAPGTIDSDYRGEMGVLLINLGQSSFTVVRGARIAQVVLAECAAWRLQASESLGPTLRGEGGFGHTGTT